jgi:hypothetical protein
VDADHGPVDDRAPLTDLPAIRRNRGGGRARGRGGALLGLPVEPRLSGRIVDDVVLGVMALRRVDGVLPQRDPGGAEHERHRQEEGRPARDSDKPLMYPIERVRRRKLARY